MHRVRPKTVLTAALAATVAVGLAVWAADPAWAREAGLDVWNVGRLEDELREHGEESARLEAAQMSQERRFELNDLLVREVYEGRRPLDRAAAELMRVNRESPGFVTVVDRYYKGPTMIAKVADNLMHRIERDDRYPKGRKAEVMARLRAEYAAAYGAAP